MYAVGRLGSYISGGLSTVSGPFHVFGGVVDIIVVEQPDGSFKSSPWYVRFGKFQGVLKAKEKIVNISVNGVEANFHMHLDQRGQAHFLKELEGEEDSVLSSTSSSNEMDEQLEENRIVKSKSRDFEATESKAANQIDESCETMARTNTHKSRVLGLVFGRKSLKEGSYQEVDNGSPMARINSLERAEIAANLLEVKWSTNLAISKPSKDDTLLFSGFNNLHGKGDENARPDDVQISHGGPSVQYMLETSMNPCSMVDQTGSCNVTGNKSQSSFESLECSGEKANVTSWSSSNMEHIIETNALSANVLEEKYETSDMSRTIDDPTTQNADDDVDAVIFISNVIATEAQISHGVEASLSQRPIEDQPSDETNVALTIFANYEGESKFPQIQTLMHSETSDNSKMDLDGLSIQIQQTMHDAREGSMEPPCCPETFCETARQLLPQRLIIQQAETIELESNHIEACDDCSERRSPCSSCAHGHDVLKPKVPVTATQIVNVDLDPLEEVESNNICTIESFRISPDHLHRDIVADSDSVLVKALNTLSVESSEDEQFLFSDLDEHKVTEVKCESSLPDGADEDNSSEFCLDGRGQVNVCSGINNEACSLVDQFVQDSQSDDLECVTGNSYAASSPLGIPKVHDVTVAEGSWAAKSLPNMWLGTESLDTDDFRCPLSHSLDSKYKPLEWIAQVRDEEGNTSSDSDNENQSPFYHSNKDDIHVLGGLEKDVNSPGDSSKTLVTSNGSWTLWPFSLKRSRSKKLTQPVVDDSKSSPAEKAPDTKIHAETDTNPKVTKRMVKTKTPTSEQLASLNLKEGRNSVTFTFSTSMLGKQEVDARIYVWKWNTRIVISDVDGTITRSDVLGQFMPLVGVDWSQMGVANLFSSIKENGYQLLFLSARAISQAYHTRQFLVNLKQDGKTLPDGPIVISPDGLFPSLFREVIRRAPHEFKIACLEDIKALFPSDHSPFYAGFGNRDTDEISYLKVGIPRGKIFIINPKGEVAVHRRVDKKTYTSLHVLVHDMFPPATSSEQEDFNSWNFWKLPPPLVNI